MDGIVRVSSRRKNIQELARGITEETGCCCIGENGIIACGNYTGAVFKPRIASQFLISAVGDEERHLLEVLNNENAERDRRIYNFLNKEYNGRYSTFPLFLSGGILAGLAYNLLTRDFCSGFVFQPFCFLLWRFS